MPAPAGASTSALVAAPYKKVLGKLGPGQLGPGQLGPTIRGPKKWTAGHRTFGPRKVGPSCPILTNADNADDERHCRQLRLPALQCIAVQITTQI